MEAAQAASRTKGSYLRSKYYKVASRRGRRRAILAVGHKILLSAYHLLKEKTDYRELGEEYLDQRQKTSLKRHYLKRLENLGYRVSLEENPMETAA